MEAAGGDDSADGWAGADEGVLAARTVSPAGWPATARPRSDADDSEERIMAKYLISFPSGAMTFPPEELPAVADASHAVVREAKAAGVWVFGGGIDESVPPVRVDAEGGVTAGTYPETAAIEGGYTVLEVPTRDDALAWAARIAAACRCAQEVRLFQHDPES
jgi:hypothetical protein